MAILFVHFVRNSTVAQSLYDNITSQSVYCSRVPGSHSSAGTNYRVKNYLVVVFRLALQFANI